MAQMRKLACDGIRTNSRGDLQVPLVSARQEILTSLVSALDSVVRPAAHTPAVYSGDLIRKRVHHRFILELVGLEKEE